MIKLQASERLLADISESQKGAFVVHCSLGVGSDGMVKTRSFEVQASSAEEAFALVDLERVVPHPDQFADNDLQVAIDKLDRMPDRRHNFDPESIDVGSMSRPEGSPVVRELRSGRETGFGAGCLFFARNTGRFLFVKRSSTGDCAGTWCTGGGGIEDWETIDEAVRRENQEELGYEGPYELIHMHRDSKPGFVFHNHMAVIEDEFEPVLNEEHTAYKWCEADDLPEPMHPGLANAISEWTKRSRGEDK